ncbi:MAG TPA: magnesium transporter [Gemmatimonadaceae bacterium]|nr:magnesium transporter [Gemmatimonadaceae bacterium]
MTPPQRKEERPVAALLAPDILALLDESPASVAAETEEMHPADLADVAEFLPRERIPALLAALPKQRAADVMEYLDEELRAEVLEEMSAQQAASIVTHMTPDERADVLEEIGEEHAEDVLAEMPVEERRETEQLLAYEPDTAGGIMTTEFVSVAAAMPVAEALAQVRILARSERKEAMHAIYATDREGRVAGVLSLRELLAAPDGATIGDIAWQEIVSVPPTADRGEVARITQEYDLVAVPVVDEQSRVIGVVTVDDVIDALVEEQTEDVQKLGAMQPLEEPYFQAGFWSIARKRGGWLTLLFVEEMFTGIALRHYEGALSSVTALMFFVPLIISSGGNSGSQSATLITRALAVGDVHLRDVLRIFHRELWQGVVLGAALGAIGFVRALMWGESYALSSVVALTLLCVVLIGTIVGAMLPLIFTRLGFDPAIASSPFVASLVDVAGIVVYFTIAINLLALR